MKSFVTHTAARMTAYRFGYTGHEKEDDLAEGVYTTQYRLLDTRLGHWMSVDPLFGKYAGISSYNYCINNPMVFMDSDGNDELINHTENYIKQDDCINSPEE